jgi:hypothetical protein
MSRGVLRIIMTIEFQPIETVMTNNSTNINKMNNHLSSQSIEHKICHDKRRWEIHDLVGTGTIMWWG